MTKVYRRRQVAVLVLVFLSLLAVFINSWLSYSPAPPSADPQGAADNSQPLAISQLENLEIKNWQAASDYVRSEFGSGWASWQTCDTRQKILARDLSEIKYGEDNCTVLSCVLNDPYTGKVINFQRGSTTSNAVQIDHVVALANAWQTGASYWDKTQRIALANDDLELLAVDGPANNQKSAADAAQWLPSNLGFRCQYVARQIAVKLKYLLWITPDEYSAMKTVLTTCPDQHLPTP
ncbi:MAG: HNH endonuclease family protein [Candidatus Nomurabacteria bacterium]|jgi:hypothetical protein|nr:HNH endonuclease family protein [Candidatus Nomurabacteria bacterium]